MRRAFAIAALAGLCLAAMGAGADAGRGRQSFEKRCTGCHTLDQAKEGPALRNVFGRGAARDPQFPYSAALKTAGATWNESTLDKWLTDPDNVAPGAGMAFRLDNAPERADIIAYLKGLAAK